MATNYTTLLGFALPTTGELSGTWGEVVNSSITELVEDAIAGTSTKDVTSADWTLSTTGSGNANEARSAILITTGTPGVSRNIVAPGSSKAYIVDNQSDAAVVVKASATTGCTINAGRSALVAWDGSDFVLISDDLSAPPPIGDVTPNTGAFTTLTATTGNITTTNSTTVDTTNIEVTNIKAKDGTASASIADSTGVMTIASSVLTTTDINGGSIDGADITVGSGKTLDVSAGTFTVANDQISGDAINGGTATPTTLTATTVNATTVDTTNLEVTNIKAKDGTAAISIADSTGVTTQTTPAIVSVNSSSDALRITQTGAGNALVVEDSSNPDSTPFVVDSEGSLQISNTVRVGGATDTLEEYSSNGAVVTPAIQNKTTSNAFASISSRYSANSTTGSPSFILAKARASNAIVLSGDTLGSFTFNGSDGTNFINAATIQAFVDGTPGTNDMPGRLVFSTTADGASSPTEAMRINSQQNIAFGYTGANQAYHFLDAKNISGGAGAGGFNVSAQIRSNVTSIAIGYATNLSTEATSFTCANIQHYRASQATIGAGSTVTSQYGYAAESTLTGATNNYGFYSNIASGTGRWNFYAAGTASNFMAGDSFFGSTAGIDGTSSGKAILGATGGSILASSRNTTSTANHVTFYNSNGLVGSISTSASATAYNTSSDYRLKEDVQPMSGNIDRLMALKPVNFAWKADGSRVDGFLAHEAQEVVPEAVTGTKDKMQTEEYEVTPAVLDDEGNVVTPAVMGTREVPDYQAIDQSKLVPLLTAALQDAVKEINNLKAQVAALQGN